MGGFDWWLTGGLLAASIALDSLAPGKWREVVLGFALPLYAVVEGFRLRRPWLAGGLAAMAAFAAIRWMSAQFSATPAGDQFEALFGGLAIGWTAFVGIGLTILLVAVLTAMSSRLAVFRFLKIFD